MTFEEALKKLPKCLGGLDLAGQHKTIADLRFLVLYEIDLFEKGQESCDIQTFHDMAECRQFLADFRSDDDG